MHHSNTDPAGAVQRRGIHVRAHCGRGTAVEVWGRASVEKFRLRAFVRQRVLHHSMQQIFTGMYRRNSWGSPESVSGEGSDLVQTRVVRQALARLTSELRIKTLLDAACGDFNWLQHVRMDLTEYIGVDIVPPLIEANTRRYGNGTTRFAVLDICTAALPAVDLILCRDCLVHLPLPDAVAVVANFVRSGSRYLLATTYPGLVRKNKRVLITGNWRPLDLQLPPFSMPEPLQVVNEECTEESDFKEKSLGLWKLAPLRSAWHPQRSLGPVH